MQELPQFPTILDKPISDKGIETVLAGAVESHPLATLLGTIFFLSFIAFLAYRLIRLIVNSWFLNTAEARKSQERIDKLNIEMKRLTRSPSKKKPPAKHK